MLYKYPQFLGYLFLFTLPIILTTLGLLRAN